MSGDGERSTGVELRLEKVMFAPHGNRILGPLDLVVRAGEPLAVTGPSGAGKTTLCLILAGVLDAHRRIGAARRVSLRWRRGHRRARASDPRTHGRPDCRGECRPSTSIPGARSPRHRPPHRLSPGFGRTDGRSGSAGRRTVGRGTSAGGRGPGVGWRSPGADRRRAHHRARRRQQGPSDATCSPTRAPFPASWWSPRTIQRSSPSSATWSNFRRPDRPPCFRNERNRHIRVVNHLASFVPPRAAGRPGRRGPGQFGSPTRLLKDETSNRPETAEFAAALASGVTTPRPRGRVTPFPGHVALFRTVSTEVTVTFRRSGLARRTPAPERGARCQISSTFDLRHVVPWDGQSPAFWYRPCPAASTLQRGPRRH